VTRGQLPLRAGLPGLNGSGGDPPGKNIWPILQLLWQAQGEVWQKNTRSLFTTLWLLITQQSHQWMQVNGEPAWTGNRFPLLYSSDSGTAKEHIQSIIGVGGILNQHTSWADDWALGSVLLLILWSRLAQMCQSRHVGVRKWKCHRRCRWRIYKTQFNKGTGVVNETRDVTDSASESDTFFRNPTDTWNPIASDSKLLTAD